MARVTILFCLAATIAAIMTGCGGGSDSASSGETVPKISKAEFITRASSICRELREDVKEKAALYLKARRGKGDSHEELVWGLVHFVVLPTIDQEVIALRRLPQPAGEEPGVRAMLSAEETASDHAATAKSLPSIAAIYPRFGEADAQFRAFGLPACANGPRHQRYNSLY